MANSDSSTASPPSPPIPSPAAPLASKKENITPVGSKLAELSELKDSLNVEVEQLRSEFQELRSTLHQQQEDVTANLRNLGLQDTKGDDKEDLDPKGEVKAEEVHVSNLEEIEKFEN